GRGGLGKVVSRTDNELFKRIFPDARQALVVSERKWRNRLAGNRAADRAKISCQLHEFLESRFVLALQSKQLGAEGTALNRFPVQIKNPINRLRGDFEKSG